MDRTLIIGYGNADRQDDGVAWHILFGLAGRLGYPLPSSIEEGFTPEGRRVDLLFVLQLTPELGEAVAAYGRVCFVDAHTGSIPSEVQVVEVQGEFQASPFTHHLTAASCLALAKTLYGRNPPAILVSVHGYEFGFETSLSPETASLVPQAVERIYQWLGI